MMKISRYSFGKIMINNVLYTKDIIILGDRIIENWRRERGHNISLDDIRLVIDYQPDILFVGTGEMGMMKVTNNFIEGLKKTGISNVIIDKSDKIIKKFNDCETPKKALAIHLTC